MSVGLLLITHNRLGDPPMAVKVLKQAEAKSKDGVGRPSRR